MAKKFESFHMKEFVGKHIIFFVLTISILSMFSMPSFSQIRSRLDDEISSITPFRMDILDKRIYIDIEINSVRLNAVVDTGMTYDFALRKSVAEKLMLRATKKTDMLGYGVADMVGMNKVRIVGATSEDDIYIDTSSDADALVLSDRFFKGAFPKADVIISMVSLMKLRIVQIDFLKQVIRTQTDKTAYDTSAAVRSVFKMVDDTPVIQIANSAGVLVDVDVDTGSPECLFDSKYFEDLYNRAGPEQRISFMSYRNIKCRYVIGSFWIGGKEIPRQSVFLAENSPINVVGTYFLSNKVITFDLRAGFAYFEWERPSESVNSRKSTKTGGKSEFTGKVEGTFQIKVKREEKKP